MTFAASIIDENGYEMPLHPELNDKDDLMSKQLLDYIFVLQPIEECKLDQNPQGQGVQGNQKIQIQKPMKLAVSIHSTKIEKFPIKDKSIQCGLCSDHFGISTVIEWNKNDPFPMI